MSITQELLVYLHDISTDKPSDLRPMMVLGVQVYIRTCLCYVRLSQVLHYYKSLNIVATYASLYIQIVHSP